MNLMRASPEDLKLFIMKMSRVSVNTFSTQDQAIFFEPFIERALEKIYEAYHQYIFRLDGEEKANFAYWAHLCEKVLKN